MSLDITPLTPKGQQSIQSYGDGGFRVTNTQYTGSLFVFTDSCISWNCTSVGDIDFNSLLTVREYKTKPEILIIGCGESFTRPPDELINAFKDVGIPLEWMATGPACRTYNVLALEGRVVAAALLAVD